MYDKLSHVNQASMALSSHIVYSRLPGQESEQLLEKVESESVTLSYVTPSHVVDYRKSI